MKFGYFNGFPSKSRFILNKVPGGLKYINIEKILKYHS
uniref:Uncharacterized protein n=1 Tax=viral metagenome TaxID=1070528 RepID=A0A6C0CP06_9ZZZZ